MQVGFNQTSFNQMVEFYVDFNTILEGQCEIDSNLGAVLRFTTELKIITETFNIFSSKLETEIVSITEMYADEFERQRGFKSNLEAITEIGANLHRIKVENITFTGEFNVGDRIIIDMDKFTVTLNGQNALHLIEGDFFNLSLGKNELIYTDEEEIRKVRIQVEYKDRWV